MRFLLTVFIFLNSICAYAEQTPYQSAEFQEVLKQDVYEPNYLSMLFGLIFVIFLIYLTGFFYQKLIHVNSKINKKTLSLPELNKIKILSSMPLGQGKNLYCIFVNGKNILIGATQNQITYLREFTRDELDNFAQSIKIEEQKADE